MRRVAKKKAAEDSDQQPFRKSNSDDMVSALSPMSFGVLLKKRETDAPANRVCIATSAKLTSKNCWFLFNFFFNMAFFRETEHPVRTLKPVEALKIVHRIPTPDYLFNEAGHLFPEGSTASFLWNERIPDDSEQVRSFPAPAPLEFLFLFLALFSL